MSLPAASQSVFSWPEFEALFERLGLDYSLPITSVQIRLQMGAVAVIEVEYNGIDRYEDEDEDKGGREDGNWSEETCNHEWSETSLQCRRCGISKRRYLLEQRNKE